MITKLLSPTPDILLAYDDLRRRQNETLVQMLDVLPRVDGLPADQMDQARDAVFHSDHPFLLALIGPFGVGKSSLINALLGEAVLATGPIPTTNQVTILRYGETAERISAQEGVEVVFHPSTLLKQISLVDTPGLESVIALHGERTDSFLHRSDWVVLVMLATQAVTASNLQYLEALKNYGKRVLVVVNQIDLLEADQRDTVQQFVREQVQIHLGTEPEVFLVSSREGLAARRADPPDAALWEASGLAALESYVTHALDDRERLRQKLQTPLQISRNVLSIALNQVQLQQRALDKHRSASDNIEAQITAARKEQHALVEGVVTEAAEVFAEVSMRGEDAVRELFQPSRALAQVTSGLVELVGLAGIARRFGARSHADAAFEAHDVMSPLQVLPKLYGDLGPRLEGRDLQDMDDLAAHTQQAIGALPDSLRSKVIGEVRPPSTYNREPLRKVRGSLEAIVDEARSFETVRLDRAVRNALVILTGWELAILLAVILLGALAIDWQNVGTPLLLVLGALAFMFVGFALMALRGKLLADGFSGRILALSRDYQDAVKESAGEQIEYGVRLRRDVAAPFSRLMAAQTDLLNTLAGDLRKLDVELSTLAGEIGGFWERK